VHVAVPVPGSIVWIRQQKWRVEAARLDRGVVRLDVADRDRRLTFLAPFDRPAIVIPRARVKSAGTRHALAKLGGVAAGLISARGLIAAARAAADILPHQLEPALAVVDGVRRILIADEVGLGKTIEAGLIIAELKKRRTSLRALVIVPRSLSDQWLQELNGRFHLDAEIADRGSLLTTSRSMRFGANPWTRPGVRIASADYLKQPHVLEAIPLLPWDVVVIDEAHDACGLSARYEAAAEMARRARRVVLLTATPHQGDPVRFGRLEGLGRLDDLAEPWTVFRRTRACVAAGTPRRIRWLYWRPTAAEFRVLRALEGFERAVVEAAGPGRTDGALLLLSIFRKRALSTMTALLVSVERRLAWIGGSTGAGHDVDDWFQPRLDLDDPGDSQPDDDTTGLTMESGLGAEAERRWLRRLRVLARSAVDRETKVWKISRLVARTAEPVVIFTEFRHSLEAIQRRLTRRRTVAVLHGGLPSVERTTALDRFERGDADVLIATDVASQGLNLQKRARWVVSVELPWTPTRIEQRIGRVDRIGQTRPVHASIVVARHPAEATLLARLARRAVHVRRALGDEALPDVVPPGERAIARSLFTGADAEARPAPPAMVMVSAPKWRRRARAVARQLVLRRTLARYWRAPNEPGGRPCKAVMKRGLPDGLTGLVVRLAISDRTGRIVDEQLISVAASTRHAQALAAALHERFRARLTRVRRLAAHDAEIAARIERAISRHLVSVGWPEEVQPGLFSGRDAQAFDQARAEVRDLTRDLAGRLAGYENGAVLQFEIPAIEAVFAPR
jgi:superfamily II DNA or RNA helicase